MELVVLVVSLKYFFVEGGEQFIVGIQTAKMIGLKAIIRITIAGVSYAVILFFLLFYSHTLISTRWLELALGITLYFFAASMFKEVIQKEDEERLYRIIWHIIARLRNGIIEFHLQLEKTRKK